MIQIQSEGHEFKYDTEIGFTLLDLNANYVDPRKIFEVLATHPEHEGIVSITFDQTLAGSNGPKKMLVLGEARYGRPANENDPSPADFYVVLPDLPEEDFIISVQETSRIYYPNKAYPHGLFRGKDTLELRGLDILPLKLLPELDRPESFDKLHTAFLGGEIRSVDISNLSPEIVR